MKHTTYDGEMVMTHADCDFDGYIELNGQEMSRLNNGEKFLTVIRPAAPSNYIKYGCPGDTLGARETNNMRPQFNLKMVSNFFANDQWIMVFTRLNTAL